MDDDHLRATLGQLPQAARSDLRRILFGDQADRDRIAERLLRRGSTDLADLLDFLSIDDQTRRRVVRLLGEMEAHG
jgi:hypothetical protein